jgi:hypothetical protein
VGLLMPFGHCFLGANFEANYESRGRVERAARIAVGLKGVFAQLSARGTTLATSRLGRSDPSRRAI